MALSSVTSNLLAKPKNSIRYSADDLEAHIVCSCAHEFDSHLAVVILLMRDVKSVHY